MRDWKALSHLVLMAIVVLALTACTGTRKKKYGQLCQDDGSCPSGALCVDGRCAALQSCQSSNDCAVGVCSEGYCWTESCTSDSQCPATLQCLEGYCIRSAETVDARDTSGEDQQTTNDQGTEKQCDVDSDCDGKVSGLGACEEVACTSGQCGKRNKPKDSTCDDQNPCTGDDKCDDKGVCQPGANVCECQKDADCTKLDDSCNKGVCNLDSHGCEKSPINEGNSCDDGNECTVTDTCKSGVCAGNPSFGASCGDGVNRHCDFYGACIEWLESTLSAPASPMSDSCTTASDCPNGGMGYSCTDGLCLCTDSNGCTCALDTGDVCSEGQVCLIRDSQQVPGDKTYRCSYQSMRQAAVCRIRESGKSDTLYLLGINFFEDFQPTTGTFDAVFDRMENGLSVETQVPQTELGLYYSNATMLCSGGVGGVSISGEGYYLYPFKLDSQKTWQPMDGLYETLSGIGGQTDNVYGSIFALQSLTLADQRIVTYWGGYLRASSLLGPGDVDPRSHEDFLVRCIENSGSSTGFDCEPRFLELHDGTTKLHTLTLPNGVTRPPYEQSNFQPTVTRLFGTLSGTAERIQTLTSAAYNEYISPDTLEFHYFISLASSDSGYWSANNPRSCAGWDGGPCDANTSVDNGLNGGMRDLDGLGDQLIIAGTAKVTSFDFDNDQIVKTPGNTPTVSPLFYYNGSSWSTLLFSPDNVLKDPKHYDGAPYDFVFDHVRFLSESMILVVGHYRTCLTDGCYNKLDNEVMVEVKVQPFVTTYDLTLASFGPMIPIGGGETRGCCVGGSCQSQPRCTNYQMRPFWLNSRVATVGLRQLTNGLEIYMAVNPVDPLGVAETTRFRPRAKIYSFISIAP